MKVYSTFDVAEMLSCNVETIRRWIKSNKLEAYRFGKEYKISQEQLNKFLETGK